METFSHDGQAVRFLLCSDWWGCTNRGRAWHLQCQDRDMIGSRSLWGISVTYPPSEGLSDDERASDAAHVAA